MKRQNGFTLVELAISLMVIGLLIGGVLKGQELIENARLTRTVTDITNYKTALQIFDNTYNALPGDMQKPASRLSNCNAAPCNVEGNGDYYIQRTAGTRMWDLGAYNTQEMRNFWGHMIKAGLISEVMDPTIPIDTINIKAQPEASIRGAYFGVNAMSTTVSGVTTTRNYIFLGGWRTTGGLTSIQAAAIDEKLDDGKPDKGSVFAMPNTTVATVSTNCAATVDSKLEYVTAAGDGKYCNLAIQF